MKQKTSGGGFGSEYIDEKGRARLSSYAGRGGSPGGRVGGEKERDSEWAGRGEGGLGREMGWTILLASSLIIIITIVIYKGGGGE